MSLPANIPFRLRFLINATGDPSAQSYQLEHNINGGSWHACGTSVGYAVYIYPSGNIAASAATSSTQQLTGGGGSFTAGRISDDTNPLPSISITSGGNTELEWSLLADATYLKPTDVVRFRITKAGVAIDTYTQTPTVSFEYKTLTAWLRA